MADRPKILLLDDEDDLLDMYKEVFSQLPSRPEIQTSNSGARAISLLESETFSLLISDLNMPKMDGLQVLSIVRRKFPLLRLVILTAVVDEQYRSRAYAMGVDLFWQKPATAQEIKLFSECIESLLDQGNAGGFRGVQSKSLIDIIQLECLSQSSSVLKLTNGGREGRIWVLNGEIIDAATEALKGEEAFKEVSSWRNGSFETFPAEPERVRTIFTNYQSLLLESVQTLDEAQEQKNDPAVAASNKIDKLRQFGGLDFVLAVPLSGKASAESWGLENHEAVAAWARSSIGSFQKLGSALKIGDIETILASGSQAHVGLVQIEDSALCAGFKRAVSLEKVRDNLKAMSIKWAS